VGQQLEHATDTGVMDPDLAQYFRLFRFSIATLVSLGLLVRLWWADELYGVSGTVFYCWFVVATAAQVLAQSTGLWVFGLVAQTLLAIVLLVKMQLTEI
jgi:hypothetical protein